MSFSHKRNSVDFNGASCINGMFINRTSKSVLKHYLLLKTGICIFFPLQIGIPFYVVIKSVCSRNEPLQNKE